MIRVLFVCHGNICRSPMAEFMLKKKVSERKISRYFYIESAATSTEEIWMGVGNPVYGPAREELARHGISCGGKRARVLIPADYDRFDYLIGMDSYNIRSMERMTGHTGGSKISLMMSWAGENKSVSDPWYSGDFRTTYKDIDRGLDGFLNTLRREGKLG